MLEHAAKSKAREADKTARSPQPDEHAADGRSPYVYRNGGMIFRKASCPCGGECPTCQFKSATVAVSQPHDTEEKEADSMADAVMRMPANAQPEPVRSVPGGSTTGSSAGGPMDAGTRSFMESRFGHDFSGVRIHHDHRAAESARSFDALAYTHGSDIVFGQGQYDPHSNRGRHLLAHELAHVVQQRSGRPKKISRAKTNVSGQTVNIDYGDVMKVADTPGDIKRRIEVFTGKPPVPDVVKRVAALTYDQQRWLLFALDILMDNTTAKHGALDKNGAVDQLIAQAAVSTSTPVANRDKFAEVEKFVREVMLTSGWTAVAVAKDLVAPGSTMRGDIKKILNPADEDGDSEAFKKDLFNQKMEKLLKDYLKLVDPGAWGSTGTQSLTQIGAIGDIVLEEAKTYFRPYVTASRASMFHLKSPWKASQNIVDANKEPANEEQRKDYVASRASKILWNQSIEPPWFPEKDIYSTVHYNYKRDGAVFTALVEKIEKDPDQQKILDRIVTHTAWKNKSGAATRIAISLEYDSSRNSECTARWKTIDTLCHEVLHALVHPDFEKAAEKQGFSQVATEGFTEVLGNELFNQWIIMRAGANPDLKAKLEAGLTVPKCPAPPDGKIDYGTAGEGAENIRKKVGYPAMKAAYFLGRTDLAGF